LKQHAEPPAQLVEFSLIQSGDVNAVYQDLTTIRIQLPRDQAQQRRLACATRTHDGRDIATGNRDIQIFEYRAMTSREVEVTNLNQCVRQGVAPLPKGARSITKYNILVSAGCTAIAYRSK
jgi:hypothetical protein